VKKPMVAVVVAILALSSLAWDARGESGERNGVGLEGKPGAFLPLDATFRDDTGALVRFGDLADRPLLVTFVYFSCSRQCPLVLGGLAEALGRLPLRPGEDYAVATISIDEGDTPAAAAAAKRNYLEAVGQPFPASAWHFLTGDRETIRRITGAAGLRFQQHEGHFFHPETVVVVAPGGAVADYLPVEGDRNNTRARIAFQPALIQLALEDARRGRIGPARPLQTLYCFPHERDIERSFHHILKVFGVVNLFGIAAIAAYLVFVKPRPAGKARG